MRLGLPARLAVLVATTLAVMSFTHPLWNFGVLCVVLGLAVWQRLPVAAVWPLIRASLAVFVLVGFCAAFATSDRVLHDPAHLQVLAQWGPLRFTVGGVLMGGTFVLRMLAMIVATWTAIYQISVDDVLDLAARWRLARRHEQIRQAQQARGQRLDSGGPVERWKANAAIVVPLITSSLLTAESLGVALSVRGYGAHRTMTVMHDVVRRPQEVALSILVLALGVCAVAGRLAWGWGRL